VKRLRKIVITLLHSGRVDDVKCKVPKTKNSLVVLLLCRNTLQSLHHLSGNDETKYNTGNNG